MKRSTLATWCLCASLLSGLATAQEGLSVGPWTVDMPSGAQAAQQNGLRAFKVGDINFIFTPAQALSGKTLEQAAQATIADLSGGKGKSKKTDSGSSNGREYLTYVLVLTETATSGQVYMLHFQRQGTQWGMALANARINGENTERIMRTSLTVLNSAVFTGNGQAAPQQAQSGGSSSLTTPALSAVAWPAPRADRVAVSKPALDYPTALKQGLNPAKTLLPTTFDCYQHGQDSEGGPRAMTPTPDLRVTIGKNGTYSFTDGREKGQGQWSVNGKDLSLTGPLALNKGYFRADDDGQRFDVWHDAREVKYTCFQAGPAADNYRIKLLQNRIGDETFQCWDVNRRKFPLTFKGNTYSTPDGGGQVLKAFRDTDGLVEFTSGPLGSRPSVMGQVKADQSTGERELEISLTTTTRGTFYVGRQKQVIAACTLPGKLNPPAVYGQGKAPATGAKGGPSGVYTVGQENWVAGGVNGTLQYVYNVVLAYFRPDGYYLEDFSPEELGGMPDCTRTKPNGLPFCDRYEVKGQQIRVQNSDGSWEKWTDLDAEKDGFSMYGDGYAKLTPLNGKLSGSYGESSSMSFGGGVATGVGTYINEYTGYTFRLDSTFEWASSRSSSTLLSGDPVTGGGAIGGGSSGSQNSGQGTYTLKDNWLTLKFTDGRVKRLFVYRIGDDSFLNIGGQTLPKLKEKK